MGDRTRFTKPNGAGRVAFGMYELIDRIAVGGMAEIFLAREAGAVGDDYLVVKRILPHFALDRQLVDMFLDEQRVAATLTHDNIVRTYDVGEVDGEYFISMEYLHGEDVRRIMRALKKRRTVMPLDLALTVISGAASGLHYAHEKKGVSMQPLDIVHRDVTPHNLVVTYDGVVKLVDFGVAKAANRLIQTSSGTIKGKVPYMSPEQCKGRPLDRRTDIYALGVILYELTTGARLYTASGVEFETMRRIVEEPPPSPRMRVPGYPSRLEAIVLKALAKSPAQRHQSADELRLELEAFARSAGLELGTDKLSRFMHELFQDDLEAWNEAEGDITKIIDQIVAKQIDSDTDSQSMSNGDFELALEQAHARARHSGFDDGVTSIRSLGTSIGNSLESVWGAADSTTMTEPGISGHYRRLTARSSAPIRPLPADLGDSNLRSGVERGAGSVDLEASAELDGSSVELQSPAAGGGRHTGDGADPSDQEAGARARVPSARGSAAIRARSDAGATRERPAGASARAAQPPRSARVARTHVPGSGLATWQWIVIILLCIIGAFLLGMAL